MSHYDDKDKRMLAVYVSIFLLLVMGIVISGYVYYRNFEGEFHHQAENQLSAIAELKVNELVNWRQERLGDAEILYHNPIFSTLVGRYFENPDDVDTQTQLLAWLGHYQVYSQYDRVHLLDVTGNERFSIPPESDEVETHLALDVAASLRSGEVTFLDFHRDANAGNEIHLNILVPIFADENNNSPLGVLVLSINPQTYLYPYIQNWPIPSDTAETLLVRRDGEDVLFLNELRFEKNTALNLRYPLTNTDIPAVKAVLGQVGIIEGKDYRGVQVLADVRHVPGSPWFLVSKIDTSEVYEPLRARLWQTLLIAGMAVFVATAGLTLSWRQQRVAHYRTRAETTETLRAGEEKFRKAFLLSPDAININRMQDGMYVSINDSFTKITGYTAEEVIGKTSVELNIWADPQDRQRLMDGLTENGAVENLEMRFRMKNGDIKQGLMSAAILELDGSPHIISIVRDITERKQAEEELARQTALFRDLFEGSPEAIAVLDIEDRVLEVNRSFTSLFGYLEAEAQGRSINDLVAPEPYLDDAQVISREVLVDGQVTEKETVRCIKDGHAVHVSLIGYPITLNGQVVGAYAIYRDITQRKMADEELNRQTALFRNLFERSPEAIAIVDQEDRISNVNHSFETLFGYSEAEIQGQHINDLIVSAPYLSEAENITHTTLGDGLVVERETIRCTKNGHPVNVFMVGYPIIVDGNVIGGSAIYRDITERKQAEKALRESEEKMSSIFRVAPTGIGVVRDRVLVEINPRVSEMTGYAKEELTGQSARILYPSQEEFEWVGSEKYKQIADKGSGTVETRWQKKDGSVIDVLLASTPIDLADLSKGVTFTVLDITERKRAEETLKESEAIFSSFLEHSPVYVFFKDKDTRSLMLSKNYEQMLGMPISNLLGKTMDEIFPSDLAKSMVTDDLRILNEGKRITIVEEFNGRVYETTKFPVLKDGKPHILAGFTLDITERKHMEDALRESEEKMRSIFRVAPTGIGIIRDQIFYEVNPRVGEITGYDTEELIGKSAQMLHITQEEFERVTREQVEQISQRGAAFVETHWRKKDENVIDVLLSSTLIDPDDFSKGATFTVLDITKRKQAEEALQESEKMFRIAFDNAPTGMSLISAAGFKYLAVNPLLCEMFGYTQDEFLGETIQLVTHPDDVERSNEWIRKKINDEPCEPEIEKRYLHRDGHIVWGLVRAQWIRNEDGSPRMAISHVLDITKRKQAEEALRESEALYRQAIEVANAVPYRQSYHVEGTTVKYDFIGEGIRQITGYGPEEFNEPLWDSLAEERFLLEELAEFSFDEAIERVRSGVNPVWKCEHRIHARDGSTHWVFEAAVELRDQNGISHGSIGLLQDVTARKQAEEEIRQLNLLLEQRIVERTAQLETANKELEAFSYSVSHDLRAPLRGIDGWSQALFEDYYEKLDEQGRLYIERVRSETQRMGHLIDDMLQLSRLTRAEMVKREVDLSALAQDIIERLQQNEPQREVIFNIQAGVTAEGDTHLLEVVLSNLLGNAFKFTVKRPNARIEFGQTEMQGRRVFFVRDNGAGFDMAYSQKLFGAFQRMHKASEFPGTGIGLATVQRVIHRHGGRVWAEAEVEHGATFFFTLG